MTTSPTNNVQGPSPKTMRTFYLIWIGQLVSTLGSGLTGFALGVYVYQTTQSTTAYALSILAFTVPGVFFSPVAGALVDRFPRRWMMILSDTGTGITTLVVLLLLLNNSLEIWHIYAANFFNGLFNTFQWPAHSAATTMLVPQEQLGRAGGLVQIGEALSQLASPAIAGVMFVVWGMGSVILVDFLTFAFAVGTLLVVRIPEPVRSAAEQQSRKSITKSIRFGLDYIRARPGLFHLLMYFATINLLFNMIGPLWTPLLLNLGSPDTAGFVGSIVGAGMLLGTLVMSAWGGPKRRVFGVVGSGMWMGFMLLFLGLPASIPLIAIVGFMSMFTLPIMGASSQALWQSKTDPDVQGRVFSVRRMLAQFTVPIGILLSGPLVDGVFEPLMATGGALSNTFIGQFMGLGPGRGLALFFVFVGLGLVLASVIALSLPRLRNVDTEIPNVQIKAQSEEEAAKEALTAEATSV
jgi:DHA3 family macrolide efflux protein-like MFS transporter